MLDKGRRAHILLTDEIALGVEEKSAQSDKGGSTCRDGATDTTIQGQTIGSSTITGLSEERAFASGVGT